MPSQVHQFAELLEAELDVAARDQRAHRHARRRLHDALLDLLRRCPSARTAATSVHAARTGGIAEVARRQHGLAHSAAPTTMSGRGAPARTAIATGERTRSTRLPTTRPAAISLSMASLASTTTSNGSPACDALGRIDAADRFDRDFAAAALLKGVGQLGQHLAGGHRRDAGDAWVHVIARNLEPLGGCCGCGHCARRPCRAQAPGPTSSYSIAAWKRHAEC